MSRTRLEAFSDGVIAILITIMVLQLTPPHGHDLAALRPLVPVFLGYVLSFLYLGIYWTNHHHLFQVVEQVDGRVLWANIHLLFWLSLVPFLTAWVGEQWTGGAAVALYGLVLLASAIAYYFLTRALLALHRPNSALAKALQGDFKEKVSIALYVVGIVLAFVNAWLGCAAYVLVALIWLIPDRRVEKVLGQ